MSACPAECRKGIDRVCGSELRAPPSGHQRSGGFLSPVARGLAAVGASGSPACGPGARRPGVLPYADVASTQIYTRVSLRTLQAVDTSTHPGAANSPAAGSVRTVRFLPTTERIEGAELHARVV